MLRPGMSLVLSLTDTFVDTLLRTDLAIRRYPSYTGAWPLPRPDFHRLEDACLAGHATHKKIRKNSGFELIQDCRRYIRQELDVNCS